MNSKFQQERDLIYFLVKRPGIPIDEFIDPNENNPDTRIDVIAITLQRWIFIVPRTHQHKAAQCFQFPTESGL